MWTARASLAVVSLSTFLLSACSALSFGVANLPARFTRIERTANVAFGPGDWQRADIYQPPNRAGPVPVIVFWYGGGWTEGSAAEYRFVGTALAGLGYIAVLPTYRVYPQVRFPVFLEDAAQAVGWVQSHIATFGGNPHRIVLMGHSAGAHMAAMLAINQEYLHHAGVDSHDIVGLIGLSGPYELAPNTATLHAIFAAPYEPRDWQVLPFVSAAAPPSLLIHGSDDRLVWASNTEHLGDALRAHQVPVTLRYYPGRGHGDTVAALSWVARFRAPTLTDIDAFMRTLPP